MEPGDQAAPAIPRMLIADAGGEVQERAVSPIRSRLFGTALVSAGFGGRWRRR
jgi:hypothetical protein